MEEWGIAAERKVDIAMRLRMEAESKLADLTTAITAMAKIRKTK